MNLIICLTPLQMLIAEKIIKQKNLKNNILLVIAYNDNDKFRYYYNRLSLLCDKAYFFLIDNSSLFKRIMAMVKLKMCLFSLNKNSFSACYLASIDSSYIQLITSGLKYHKLYTFDDGTINLLEGSPYYKDKCYSIFENGFRKLFSIKDTVSFYRQASVLHYTIFKDNKNIVENTEYIPLLEKKNKCNSHGHVSGEIKIFLGQPLSEIKVGKQLLLNFFVDEKIDFYYPHPRETELFENVNYIKSERIFEDFFIDYVEKNQDKEIVVYTFFSTAILNIKDIDNVRIFPCYTEQIDHRFYNVYDLFRKMNIPIKYIE